MYRLARALSPSSYRRERVSPRVFPVMALPTATEREKSQMYVQRYVQHFPAAGEVVIFDRSWYNRAGVEPVMGFCKPEETERFLALVSGFEKAMTGRWYDYSRARDAMFAATDTAWAPGYIADADDKKRARLNIISHLLSQIPYKPVPHRDITLPKRQPRSGYRQPDLPWRRIPAPF
jgi:polyphosphate kinase 2 (PPK2 family)